MKIIRNSIVVMPLIAFLLAEQCRSQQPLNTDPLSELQRTAIHNKTAKWGHWGGDPNTYSSWTSHSNRLVPVYTFGLSLNDFAGENSVYRNAEMLKHLYGRVPDSTLSETADYLDQTDIYRLQMRALELGKKYVFLIVFDGMDWNTTQAAAIYNAGENTYRQGRGRGLGFLEYSQVETDYGWMVTSPYASTANYDVNGQVVLASGGLYGGYNPQLGGFTPWERPASFTYLMSQDRNCQHAYVDSAASATAMTCGIKTTNGAINVDPQGKKFAPITRQLQKKGFSIGVVTSVPISHATPACAYANNVSRNDYQDLTRDLLGLPSVANRRGLKGLDVLIGCGFGIEKLNRDEVREQVASQGRNFQPGNKYVAKSDWDEIARRYLVVKRQRDIDGGEALIRAAAQAKQDNRRLFGFFGTSSAHLPYQTANGDFCPAPGITNTDVYTDADVFENPTLADMTDAALTVLEDNEKGFWMMIEPGDVDWANHNNNIDDAIGAVLSGDAAFRAVCRWAEANECWDQTAVIVTADHGHLFFLQDPQILTSRNPSVVSASK